MPEYEVILTHSFVVKIRANSAEDAVRLSEFFVSYSDGSSEQDRKEQQFSRKKTGFR